MCLRHLVSLVSYDAVFFVLEVSWIIMLCAINIYVLKMQNAKYVCKFLFDRNLIFELGLYSEIEYWSLVYSEIEYLSLIYSEIEYLSLAYIGL